MIDEQEEENKKGKMACKKAKQDLKALSLSNQHDLEKLMSQHKLDIGALEEKHKQQLEIIEKEHTYKLELMQKEHENELVRKEKELEDTAKYGMMKDLAGGLLTGVFSSAINSPKIKEEIEKKIAEGFTQGNVK